MSTISQRHFTGGVVHPLTMQTAYQWSTEPAASLADTLKRLVHPQDFFLDAFSQKKAVVGVIFSSCIDQFIFHVYRNFPEDLNQKAEAVWQVWEDHQTQRNCIFDTELGSRRSGLLTQALDSNADAALSLLKSLDKVAQQANRPGTRYWLKLCRVRLDADIMLYNHVLHTSITPEKPLQSQIARASEFFDLAQKKAEKNNWFTRLTKQATLSNLTQQLLQVPTSEPQASASKAEDPEVERESYNRKAKI